MRKECIYIVNIVCLLSILADCLYVWIQLLFSYGLSLLNVLLVFLLPFTLRNIGIVYFLTEYKKIWGKPYYILDILIGLIAVSIIINTKATLIELDNYHYYLCNSDIISYDLIFLVFIPYCVRVLFFFYFLYKIVKRQRSHGNQESKEASLNG